MAQPIEVGFLERRVEDNDCIWQIIAKLPGIGNIAFLGHSLASGLQGINGANIF